VCSSPVRQIVLVDGVDMFREWLEASLVLFFLAAECRKLHYYLYRTGIALPSHPI
jgi:hypothetical protein